MQCKTLLKMYLKTLEKLKMYLHDNAFRLGVNKKIE